MSRVIDNPRQLILDKAEEILHNEGYAKLSMRNVAKACDIAIGTIYNYYPTKKDLVIEMMMGYWEKYFHILEGLLDSDYEFYTKLRKIFDELGSFIKTFKEAWLKRELYDKPDYIENGLEKEYLYFEKLVRKIEVLLTKEASVENSKIQLKLDSYETAKFIVLNFIAMVQMPFFRYTSFEMFLKELLKTE